MSIQTRPIVTWPGKMTPHRERLSPRYKIAPAVTRTELLRELEAIKATDCFIQAAYSEDQIRLDGMPRSGAVPAHPGIILTYSVKSSPIPFDLPCDAFRDAEQNLRAICLTLQRLRLIEETGVKTHGRQYEGFRRLPAPSTATTKESAAAVIIELSSVACTPAEFLRDAELRASAYRSAALNCHPDRSGGSDEIFKRLQEAKELIDKEAL